MNNKVDLEIRILDGILKLLNAISTAPVSTNTSILPASNVASNATTTNTLDGHIVQILTACKCLFVSHRKIAIYLNDVNNLHLNKSASSSPELLIKSGKSDSHQNKLYLSNIRIPLSWKWNDYVKASKNAGNLI